GNGTYWELAANNQVAFSDHLDSVNAQVSIGSDGLEVITDVYDKVTDEIITLKQTTTYSDRTSMTDGKVDNVIYFKTRGKYFERVIDGVINATWFGLSQYNTPAQNV